MTFEKKKIFDINLYHVYRLYHTIIKQFTINELSSTLKRWSPWLFGSRYRAQSNSCKNERSGLKP